MLQSECLIECIFIRLILIRVYIESTSFDIQSRLIRTLELLSFIERMHKHAKHIH